MIGLLQWNVNNKLLFTNNCNVVFMHGLNY